MGEWEKWENGRMGCERMGEGKTKNGRVCQHPAF